MPRSRRLFLLALVLCAPLALAQDEPPTKLGPEAPTIAAVRSSLAAVARNLELDEALRAQVTSAYEDAIAQLEQSEEQRKRAATADRLIEEAPAKLEELRATLAKPPELPTAEAPEGATLSGIEDLRAQALERLEDAREAVQDLRAEQARHKERRGKASQELVALVKAREELIEQLKAPLPRGTNELLAEALTTRLQAKRVALDAKARALEREVASYDAQRQLLQARLDLATREETLQDKRAKAWQELAATRRRIEAERARLEAEKASRDAEDTLRKESALNTPQLLALAELNRTLASLRTGEEGTSARLVAVDAELSEVRKQLTDLRASFRLVRRKARVAGVSNALGVLLRKKLDTLPDAKTLERALLARQEDLADLQFQLILREEERLQAGDVVVQLDETLGSLQPEERARVEDVARELLVSRRTLLDDLITDYNRLFKRMVDLDTETAELIDGTREYRRYVEERIFWVRNIAGSELPSLREGAEAFAALSSPGGLWTIGRLAAAEATKRWVRSTLWTLLLVLFAVSVPFCQRGLARCAESVWKPNRDSFSLTLAACVYTVFPALPIPLALWGLSRLIYRSPDMTSEGVAASYGLAAVAELLLGLDLIRRLLLPRGLAIAHFRWRTSTVDHLRKHLRWFIPVVLVTAYFTYTVDQLQNTEWNRSLGRISFVIAALAYSVFIQRVLRPGAPVMTNYLKRHKTGWLRRLRWVWYPVASGLPLILALVSLQGYHYTALRLIERTEESLWLVSLLVVAHAILIRWLRLTRTQLIHQQIAAEAEAEEARQAAEAAARQAAEEARKETGTVRRPSGRLPRASDTTSIELDSASAVTIDLEEVDHAALSSQSQRFFRTLIALAAAIGFSYLWADVLPALRRLDQIQVWPSIQYLEVEEQRLDVLEGGSDPVASTVGGAEDAPKPSPSAGIPGTPPLPAASTTETFARTLSLADVGLSILILVLTIIAAQTVPGLLEFLLLSRVDLDSGTRYAIRTVALYFIVLIGVSFGLGMIGFRWDSIQWLAAALTFGLAFGLQEIFANFVSGLLILFERPIRLGDWITVGTVTGVVTRIRIRATTITDRDNKELIVPNKEFVTGNVINWALTDNTLRVKVPVGVAYGTPPAKVREALLKIAADHPRILQEPTPQALFLGFGASSLDWQLHVFIENPSQMLRISDELHSAIAEAFTEQGIEIAFPQLDLHLRTGAELLRAAAEAKSAEPAPAPADADEGEGEGESKKD